MRMLFGRTDAGRNDGNNGLPCRTGAYEKTIRIALAVLIVMTFWAGPYNMLKIQNYAEVEGYLQAYDVWKVRRWRQFSVEADIYIEITLDEEKYEIDMDYVEQDVLLLAGTIDDHIGDIIRIKHMDDWSPLSRRRLIIDMRAGEDALFDDARLEEIWNQRAAQDMWIGLMVIVLGGLFRLKETGWIRIVRDKNS